jgi:hypothetical protein
MINKHILFIDDSDVSEIIEKLRTALKRQGIILIEKVFNINNPIYRISDPANPGTTKLDFDKIKIDLQENIMLSKFDYVISDFNFKDKYLNGFKLVKWLKNYSNNERRFKIRKANFSLYSSERDKLIKTTLSEEEISQLIKLKIEDFYERTRITIEFGSLIIRRVSEIDLKGKLISELEQYKEMKFKNTYPFFKDYTLEKISTEIEDETHHGIQFQNTLIELAISHMINLNNEE